MKRAGGLIAAFCTWLLTVLMVGGLVWVTVAAAERRSTTVAPEVAAGIDGLWAAVVDETARDGAASPVEASAPPERTANGRGVRATAADPRGSAGRVRQRPAGPTGAPAVRRGPVGPAEPGGPAVEQFAQSSAGGASPGGASAGGATAGGASPGGATAGGAAAGSDLRVATGEAARPPTGASGRVPATGTPGAGPATTPLDPDVHPWSPFAIYHAQGGQVLLTCTADGIGYLQQSGGAGWAARWVVTGQAEATVWFLRGDVVDEIFVGCAGGQASVREAAGVRTPAGVGTAAGQGAEPSPTPRGPGQSRVSQSS